MNKEALVEAIKILAENLDKKTLLELMVKMETPAMSAEEAYSIGSEIIRMRKDTDERIAEYERSQIDAG